MELGAYGGDERYCKIEAQAEQIEQLLITEGVKAIPRKSLEIVLDFDATDDPLHGHREGAYFHGYYKSYCYLPLYEQFCCARGDMENRIKEQQLDLFSDRTSTHLKGSDQLRLWFSAFANLDRDPTDCSPQSPNSGSLVESRGGAVSTEGSVSTPPLIKPDVRISRIRLSDQGGFMLSPTGGTSWLVPSGSG